MKVPFIIIVAGAAIALVAPAANAASGPTSHTGTSGFKVVHPKVGHHKIVTKHPTINLPRPQLYIYQLAPFGSIQVQTDSCAASANGCTDQELCDIWGMNCDLVAAASSSSDATTTEAAPAATGGSDAVTAPADSSASSNDSSSASVVTGLALVDTTGETDPDDC